MATDRQKRQERRERRKAAQVPVSRITPNPMPANRGTFRVAQALRQLALDVPPLVRVKDRPKHQGVAKRSPSATAEAPQSRPATERRRAPERKPAPALTINKPDPRLKCRPKDSSPKGGAGSDRPFVPWGKC